LDLSANRLDTFSDDLLSRLNGGSLHHLNLSENQLDTLPHGRVYGSVRVLDVRGNRLQSTSSEIVQQLNNNTHLREFFFTRGNLWNCQSRFTKELLAFASRVTFNGVATDYLGACSD
jgi:Leucine-rich repeat (LRR) protein